MVWNQALIGVFALLSLLLLIALGWPLWQRRREPAAAVLLACLVAGGIGVLYDLSYGVIHSITALFQEPRTLSWQAFIQNLRPVGIAAFFLSTAFWLHFSLIFPARRPLLHRFRWLPVLFYAPMGAMAALILAQPFLPPGIQRVLLLPAGPIGQAIAVTAGLASLVGIASLLQSCWQARSRRIRRALIGLLIGTGISAALGLGTLLIPALARWPVPMGQVQFLEPLALLILLGTFVFTVAQYELFNIRLAVSRGLAYSLAALVVLGFYLFGAVAIIRLLGRAIAPDSPLFLVLFVVLMTLVLNPVRLWIQQVLDRLFFRQRYDYRRVMREFSQDLAQLKDLPVLTRLILDRVVDIWKLRTAALILREEEGEDYLVREARGLPERCQAATFAAEAEVTEYLARQHRPVDCQEQGEWPGELSTHDRAAFQSLQGLLVVPLWVKDEFIGWFHLGEKRSGRPYNEEDVELLAILADQASAALGNALLYERRRREVAALEVLNRISLVATTLDLDDLLEWIYREVALLVDAPNLCIALHDGDIGGWSYAFVVENGVRQRPKEGTPWAPENSLANDVVHSGEPIVTRDYLAECRRREIHLDDADQGKTTLAWLGIPLLAGTRVLGALWISSPQEGTVYRAEHVRLLSTIAAQVAVVIERARVHKREGERVAELQILNEIAQASGSSIHLDKILQVIHQSVQRVIAAPDFYVALYDPAREEFSFALHIEQGKRTEPARPQWSVTRGLSGEILRLRLPIVTEDYQAECIRRGIQPTDWRRKAWLGVPLIVGEEIIGVMVASTTEEEKSYTAEDVRLFSTIGAQVAGAVQNARRYQESRRRLEELTALFQLGTTIASTLDLREVLDTVCRETVHLLKVTSAYVSLWDEEGRTSTVIAEYVGPEASPLEQISDLGGTYSEDALTMELIREGQPAVWHGSDSSLPTELHQHLEQYGGKSVLFLPLIARGHPTGFIEAWESRNERDFTDDEILLGRNLASQAAIAIENARLYKRTDAALTRRVEELTVVEEISRELSISLDPHHVIEVLMERAMAATGATAGAVAMLTPDEQGLLLLTYRGYPEQVAKHYRTSPWNVDQGVIGRVVRTNQPVLLTDVRQSPDYAAIVPSTTSELAVPIRYGDKPVGVINLESDRPGAFDQEHLRFVHHLSEHAAIAIRNARLFQERERRITELSILNEIGRAISSPMGLDALLEIVHQQVSRIFDTTNFYIALYDEQTDEWTSYLDIEHGQRQTPTRYPGTAGLTGHIIHHREPILLRTLAEGIAIDQQLGRETLGEQAMSWLGVPLIAADKVVGVMAIQSYEQENLYDEQDLGLFSTIAAQAAIAIDNARLIQGVTEARDRLQAILDSTHDGIMMLDEEGRILLANPSIERWAGLLREKVIGRTLVELIRQSTRGSPELRRSLLEGIRRSRQALARDPQVVLHGSFENPTGIAQSFEWMSLPVLDQQGQRIGRILAVHDVTEARQADLMREDLVSMIVHDLRGPLTALLGSLETLLQWDTGPLTDVQKTLLEVALEGGQRILNMVNTLLDIRRLEAGKMPLRFGPVQLVEAARLAISHLEGLAQEHHLAILVDIPADLPAVRADTEKLTRVWENLLHNAIKYSYPGGVIRLGARKDGARVLCMVMDHGVGIPKAEQERIFEKFTQGHRPSAPRGTGLGLAFCRLAVEAHRGRIWVESEEGKGSTFYFTVPLWGV